MQELSAWAHGLRQLKWGGAESRGGWAGVSVLPREAKIASASPFLCFKSLCSLLVSCGQPHMERP